MPGLRAEPAQDEATRVEFLELVEGARLDVLLSRHRDVAPRLCIALIALLTGCGRNEQAHLQKTVASVSPTTLLADAARLAADHPDKQGFPVDPSILPASFRAFAPVEVWRYDGSFLIVTVRSLQHRTGVLVQPLDYPEPTKAGNDQHTKLAPGIYFYSS